MSSTLQLPSTPPVWEGVSAPKRALWRIEGILYRHRYAIALTALIVIGVAIRLWVNRGLWLDEATTVAQAKMGFGRMLSYMRQSDVHPPLFQTVMWLDLRAFGTSEFAVRLPSLVFGSLLIPVMYGAGKDLFSRRTGLVAALVAALGPAAVWYSQEARMYPMFMLFAAIAIWAQVRAVRTGSKWAWAAYSASTIALLWTHYFAALHVVVQQVAFLYLIWNGRKSVEGRRLLGAWLRSTFAILIFIAPLAYLAIGQMENYGVRDTTTVAANGAADSGSPVYTAISNLASALVGYHSTETMTKINALWPLAMLAALLTLGRGRTRTSALLTALVFFPLAVLFVVGLSRNDVFELRYFAGAVPAIALLIARAVTMLAKRTTSLVAMCLAISLVLGVALWDEQNDGGNARLFDFKSALSEVNQQHQPGDLMLYEPFYLHPTVHYYADNFRSYPLVAGLQSTTAPNRIFIVDSLAFAEKEVSRQRVQQVTERLSVDRELVQHIKRSNIEVWVFQ